MEPRTICLHISEFTLFKIKHFGEQAPQWIITGGASKVAQDFNSKMCWQLKLTMLFLRKKKPGLSCT